MDRARNTFLMSRARQTAKASFGQVETDGFCKAAVNDIAHAMRAAAEVPISL